MSAQKTKTYLRCADCGMNVEEELNDFLSAFYQQNGYICPKCLDIRKAKREAEEDAQFKREREQRIRDNMAAAGVPDEYNVMTPPVPFVSEWLSARFNANILLHGYVGAGKSTSAGYNARQALFRGFKVKWYMLSALLDEWRVARCSENPLDVPYLFRRLESFDLIILDECDKSKDTASVQEFMFRLLEDVANGTSHAKLWMLGNFYKGSLGNIFGNEDAARRRFNESFQCAMIKTDGTIKRIKL